MNHDALHEWYGTSCPEDRGAVCADPSSEAAVLPTLPAPEDQEVA